MVGLQRFLLRFYREKQAISQESDGNVTFATFPVSVAYGGIKGKD